MAELVRSGANPSLCGFDAQATKNPADGIGCGSDRKRRAVAANEQGFRIRAVLVDEYLTPIVDVASQLSDKVILHGHDARAPLAVAGSSRCRVRDRHRSS